MSENISYFLVDGNLFCMEKTYLIPFMFRNNEWKLSEFGVYELTFRDSYEDICPADAMEITGGISPAHVVEEYCSVLDDPEITEHESER